MRERTTRHVGSRNRQGIFLVVYGLFSYSSGCVGWGVKGSHELRCDERRRRGLSQAGREVLKWGRCNTWGEATALGFGSSSVGPGACGSCRKHEGDGGGVRVRKFVHVFFFLLLSFMLLFFRSQKVGWVIFDSCKYRPASYICPRPYCVCSPLHGRDFRSCILVALKYE